MTADTMSMFGDPEPPPPPSVNAKPSGKTTPRHTCPGCGALTRRRVRRFPTLGYVDERCARCAVTIAAWPEQATDPRRPDSIVEQSIVQPERPTP